MNEGRSLTIAISSDSFPACWFWPAKRTVPRIFGEPPELAEIRQRAYLSLWRAARCAICGLIPDKLAYDHDHATNLGRGLLCLVCNLSEGRSKARIFAAYRWRNPASILGLHLPLGDRQEMCDVYWSWRYAVEDAWRGSGARLDLGTLANLNPGMENDIAYLLGI